MTTFLQRILLQIALAAGLFTGGWILGTLNAEHRYELDEAKRKAETAEKIKELTDEVDDLDDDDLSNSISVSPTR